MKTPPVVEPGKRSRLVTFIRQRFLPLTLCTLALACEIITGPKYPDVSGTYTGPITVASTVLTGSLTGTMTISVVQADEQITFTGFVTFMGVTSQLAAHTGTINETGFFTTTAGGAAPSAPDPQCGIMTTTSATLTFSGKTARYHQSVATTYCGALTFDGTLTR